jgi:hypothetical protein
MMFTPAYASERVAEARSAADHPQLLYAPDLSRVS